MKTESRLPRQLGLLVLLSVWTVALPDARAGSLIVPAWSFARGNMKIDADPGKCADAGPVVIGGVKEPWGWTVEYDIEERAGSIKQFEQNGSRNHIEPPLSLATNKGAATTIPNNLKKHLPTKVQKLS